jgi:hypothetical protein
MHPQSSTIIFYIPPVKRNMFRCRLPHDSQKITNLLVKTSNSPRSRNDFLWPRPEPVQQCAALTAVLAPPATCLLCVWSDLRTLRNLLLLFRP